tara:strand:- start:240 stop:476 length:237 start_codon:yes stop_codon:yes gene_type:complete
MVSAYSGIERTLEIPIAPLDYEKWAEGALIQRVAPYLTPAEREFMKSGMYGDEFAQHREELARENPEAFRLSSGEGRI